MEMIPDKFLQEFKAIHKRKTGQDMSDQDALASAIKLITLVKAVYRPIPKKWLKELEAKDEKK